MFTQNEVERERYEARLKYQRDEASRLQYATETGEKLGELIGRIQAYQEILKTEPTAKETLRAMPLEQLQELVDQLKTGLAGRK